MPVPPCEWRKGVWSPSSALNDPDRNVRRPQERRQGLKKCAFGYIWR